MNAHLPALQKVESADLGAVPAGRFCLGVMGGNFSPRRHQDTKKEWFFTTKARRHDERGILPRSAGRRLANLGALCGFVVQTLPLMAGRVWLKGGRLLVFGSCLGCAGVAESASNSGFRTRVSAESTSNFGFHARVSAESTSNSGFRAKNPCFRSKHSGFDEKHPFFSENAAFFHADTLPAVTLCFLPFTIHQSPVTTLSPQSIQQTQQPQLQPQLITTYA